MSNELGVWIALVASPSLFAVVLYFFHDYKNGTDDRITRLEGLAMSASKKSNENESKLEKIKHEIEIVIKEDTRSLLIVEMNHMKHDLELLKEKDRLEMSDIKNHDYFINRHEQALGKIHTMLTSHYNKIQDLYIRLNNKSLP